MWYWIIGTICFVVGGTVGVFAAALLVVARGRE